MHDDNQHTASIIANKFFLVITEQGNNRLLAIPDTRYVVDAGPGDQIIEWIPLDITLQEFAELHNKALTHTLEYDRMSNKIMWHPKNQAQMSMNNEAQPDVGESLD